MADQSLKRFMKPKTVASELQLSYKKTLELIRTGVIPSHKFGRVYRIDRGELEIYIQRQKFHRKHV